MRQILIGRQDVSSFEPDYRPGGPDIGMARAMANLCGGPAGIPRSAHDAVGCIYGLLNRGYREPVDLELSNYCGEIPHTELMRCIARRVSHGPIWQLLKA
ncbi:MAG: hypothetical protein OXI38_02690 [Bacteroidota bacterium]|nr:hypothetical protein [Bacteroidota bacterium]